MRTVQITAYGQPEVLGVTELPTPEPAAGEVRVAVTAAALNPVDAAVRAGAMAPIIGERFPYGFGWDVAGTVDAVGEGVDSVSIGDHVVGLVIAFGIATGTHASHVVLPPGSLARAPRTVDAATASTLPLNALTADQALDLLGLAAGSTVVVTGAAGGVGDYAVALGAQRGLRIIAVAGAEDEQWVRSAGAEHFVARGADLAGAVRELVPGGADGLLDAARLGATALAVVRDGGSFAAVTGPDTPAAERGITVSTVQVAPNGARLAELVGEVDAGHLRLRVAETYPLDEVAAAHERLAKGGLRGRIVLVP